MAAPYPQVVLFGDSIFQMSSNTLDGFCFQGALQNLCIRRYDVVNRGLSGYNTSQALQALPGLFPKTAYASSYVPKVAYFIVLLGANDAAVKRTKDNQHVDIADYEANLKSILTHPHILEHKARKTLLVTPPPMDSIRRIELARIEYPGSEQFLDREARITAQYAEAARRVAKDVPGTVLVDLWKELYDVAVKRTPDFDPKSGGMLGDVQTGKSGYLRNLLTDGLHLSGEGYRVLFEAIKPHIDAEYEPRQLPDWQIAPWLTK